MIEKIINKKKKMIYEYIFISNKKKIFCFLKNENYSIKDLLIGTYIGVNLLQSMNISPKIGILSGGRIGDKGRSKDIDKIIKKSEILYNILDKYGFDVINHMILIENAMKYSNLLIIHDLVSFNFIINTLINIGKFKQLYTIKVFLNL